ncbi:MAG: hypothetical protein NXI31_08245 [bacterium]|nr:hypothetical protein [bacterium]
MADYSLFALGQPVSLDGEFVLLAVRDSVRAAAVTALEPLGIHAIPAPD